MMKDDVLEIYEKYHRLIIHIGYLQLGNIEMAKEVAQETFVKLISDGPTTQNLEEMKRWLIRVAINMCLDNKRKIIIRLKYWFANRRVEEAFELNSPEIKDQLRDVLTRVDGKTKMAIILKYANEMALNEIADVMGLPEATVKTLIYRGLEKIRGKNE